MLLGIAAAMFEHVKNPFISLAVLCLGNCFVHVNGAETTLRTADGRLAGSAIFVSGGIMADRFGFRRTALLSAFLDSPFLMAGDNHMIISLIGVMLFSMTMAITLGILVSVLQETPGLAFGLTTIGLFIGTAPVFFFKFTTLMSNCIMIAILTVLCLLFMWIIIRRDEADE